MLMDWPLDLHTYILQRLNDGEGTKKLQNGRCSMYYKIHTFCLCGEPVILLSLSII